jgi:transposase
MEITVGQYARIKDSLPVQRGNVKLTNLQVLNAILYVAEHGCNWRGLPTRFARWHTIYKRMNLWAKNEVLVRVFEKLQMDQIVRIQIEALWLDSTPVLALQKNRPTSHRQVSWRMEYQNSPARRR